MKSNKYLIIPILTVILFISCTKDTTGTPLADALNTKVAKSDNEINTATLPQVILDYITANYSGKTIIKSEIEINGNYEVTLNDNTELIFDANGQFLGVDNDGNDDFGDSHINPADLPQAIKDFIATNYPNASISEAELENNGNYEVELSNDTVLVFDANGDFLGIGVDQDNLNDENEDGHNETDIDPATLPQPVKDYITANYPNETIVSAEVESDGNYEVTLSNRIELYFNPAGEFLRIGDGDDDGDGHGD